MIRLWREPTSECIAHRHKHSNIFHFNEVSIYKNDVDGSNFQFSHINMFLSKIENSSTVTA